MTDIILQGICGRMGHALIEKIAQREDCRVVAGIDQQEQFQFTPWIFGFDSDGNNFKNDGPTATINYTMNNIVPEIQDIDYGMITPFATGQIIKRDVDEIVKVDDQRRVKNPMKVYLNQNAALNNQDGNALSASLRYYHDCDNYSSIYNNPTLIYTTTEGQMLDLISWESNLGLLLSIDDLNLIPGRYQTTLNWSFEDSV